MKRKAIIFSVMAAGLLFVLPSCKKEDMTNEDAMPKGDFTVERSGNLSGENGITTAGKVEYGKDEDNVYFVHFGSDFSTDQGSGTLGLYFSTSATFTADPQNGNPDLKSVSTVTKNGEQYFKLDGSVSSSFTHVILWCNTAQIAFGTAQLQ